MGTGVGALVGDRSLNKISPSQVIPLQESPRGMGGGWKFRKRFGRFADSQFRPVACSLDFFIRLFWRRITFNFDPEVAFPIFRIIFLGKLKFAMFKQFDQMTDANIKYHLGGTLF